MWGGPEARSLSSLSSLSLLLVASLALASLAASCENPEGGRFSKKMTSCALLADVNEIDLEREVNDKIICNYQEGDPVVDPPRGKKALFACSLVASLFSWHMLLVNLILLIIIIIPLKISIKLWILLFIIICYSYFYETDISDHKISILQSKDMFYISITQRWEGKEIEK